MKCYCLIDELDYDGPLYKIVFANSKGQAKSKATQSGNELYNINSFQCDYTKIRCLRYPLLDNHEDDIPENIMKILIEEYGWYFTFNDKFYDLDNIDEFIEDCQRLKY